MDQFDKSQEIQRDDEAVSVLLSGMGHEIRTPMNGILGMAELLLAADDLSERHRRRIEIIKRSGDTLLALIEHILDLSRIEAGQLQLKVAPFDLRELVNEIYSQFEPKVLGKALQFDLLDHLGNHHEMVGDPLYLRKILSNILSKTLYDTTEGRISILAAAKPTPAGNNQVRFEVEHSGAGSKSDIVDRIVAPSNQGTHLAANDLDVANLGLVICKKLTAMIGGEIDVENTPGGGSLFRLGVEMQRQVKIASTMVQPEQAPAARCPGRATTSLDILVAEDNPDMAALVEDMLDDAGHRSTVASDGASVLKILSEQHFDVVLMDGRMPDMSGFETTERIRQFPDERAKIPIIALTAEAMAGDRERFLSAGMDDYVSKPIDYDKLIEAITRCHYQARPKTPTLTLGPNG